MVPVLQLTRQDSSVRRGGGEIRGDASNVAVHDTTGQEDGSHDGSDSDDLAALLSPGAAVRPAKFKAAGTSKRLRQKKPPHRRRQRNKRSKRKRPAPRASAQCLRDGPSPPVSVTRLDDQASDASPTAFGATPEPPPELITSPSSPHTRIEHSGAQEGSLAARRTQGKSTHHLQSKPKSKLKLKVKAKSKRKLKRAHHTEQQPRLGRLKRVSDPLPRRVVPPASALEAAHGRGARVRRSAGDSGTHTTAAGPALVRSVSEAQVVSKALRHGGLVDAAAALRSHLELREGVATQSLARTPHKAGSLRMLDVDHVQATPGMSSSMLQFIEESIRSRSQRHLNTQSSPGHAASMEGFRHHGASFSSSQRFGRSPSSRALVMSAALDPAFLPPDSVSLRRSMSFLGAQTPTSVRTAARQELRASSKPRGGGKRGQGAHPQSSGSFRSPGFGFGSAKRLEALPSPPKRKPVPPLQPGGHGVHGVGGGAGGKLMPRSLGPPVLPPAVPSPSLSTNVGGATAALTPVSAATSGTRGSPSALDKLELAGSPKLGVDDDFGSVASWMKNTTPSPSKRHLVPQHLPPQARVTGGPDDDHLLDGDSSSERSSPRASSPPATKDGGDPDSDDSEYGDDDFDDYDGTDIVLF